MPGACHCCRLPPPGRQGSCRLCHDLAHRGMAIVCTPALQVPGRLFLFGDGDCGQLGMGEEVTERLRPFPLDMAGGKKVRRWTTRREHLFCACPCIQLHLACTGGFDDRVFLTLQVLQVACGGMHTVALTADSRIFSWGVNDEGALGRETGAQGAIGIPRFKPETSCSTTGWTSGIEHVLPLHHLFQYNTIWLFVRPCAAGELWEKSGQASGKPGDAYTPGEVHMPAEAGKAVQLSAGVGCLMAVLSKQAGCTACQVLYCQIL